MERGVLVLESLMSGGAVFDGPYRYRLWREWDAEQPRITFVMLNPSTANQTNNDPTIRRVLGFAQTWGYGSLEVVNLFAWCASDPRELSSATDAIGPENNRYLLEAATRSLLLVVAWGQEGRLRDRDQEVLQLLASQGHSLSCLGTTLRGCPKHPLYLSRQTQPQCFASVDNERCLSGHTPRKEI